MFMPNFRSLPATQAKTKFRPLLKKISEFFRKTLERISKSSKFEYPFLEHIFKKCALLI
jgi:hypothetical protein